MGRQMKTSESVVDFFIGLNEEVEKASKESRPLVAEVYMRAFNAGFDVGRKRAAGNRCPKCGKKDVGETVQDERCGSELCWCPE